MTPAFLDLVDLASERLGAAVVAANDEFFAPKERLIASGAPRWVEGKYTERGKWVDGWETRRRREPGHDWCLIRLGAPGVIRGVDVETTYFRGNFPEACAIDVCDLAGLPAPEALERAPWCEVLSPATLSGDVHNLFAVDHAPRATHIRLRIFPDGGVARLRAYGEAVADWAHLSARGQVDLAAAEHGGVVVACSDMFFGARHNLIMPGDARDMGDGWETKRRRGPGHEWTIIRLGTVGTIERIVIDTRMYKGNAPGACDLEGCRSDSVHAPDEGVAWHVLLPRTPLLPDARHTFENELAPIGDVNYVRFNIFPDGGVRRLRLFGRPSNQQC